MVWGVVLPRVTPLVAARTAVLGLAWVCSVPADSSLHSCPVWLPFWEVVGKLGIFTRPAMLAQLCGGKIALLLVLELRFCACYLRISEKCWGGRM